MELLEEIEAAMARGDDGSEQVEHERFDRLLDWMKENGADFSKLELRYYSADWRGVHAKEEIKKGDTVLFVPHDTIVTLDLAKESPLGKYMVENEVVDYMYYKMSAYFAVFLMQERKNPNSKFKAYLDILPKSHDDFPIFFTDAEKEFLKGSSFLDLVEEKMEDLLHDYGVLVRRVPGFKEEYSFLEYMQASTNIVSRVYNMDINGVNTNGMAPYADMLNHNTALK